MLFGETNIDPMGAVWLAVASAVAAIGAAAAAWLRTHAALMQSKSAKRLAGEAKSQVTQFLQNGHGANSEDLAEARQKAYEEGWEAGYRSAAQGLAKPHKAPPSTDPPPT